MTYNPQKPRYTLPFADKDYELEGSFGLIEAVEYALADNIISIAQSSLEMPVFKISRLLAAVFKQCGFDKKQPDIFETIVNDIGVASEEFAMLRFHIFAFLKICICKPSDREQVAKDMGEMIGKLETPSVSPGENTSNSA